MTTGLRLRADCSLYLMVQNPCLSSNPSRWRPLEVLDPQECLSILPCWRRPVHVIVPGRKDRNQQVAHGNPTELSVGPGSRRSLFCLPYEKLRSHPRVATWLVCER